jgi:hypothetical protein
MVYAWDMKGSKPSFAPKMKELNGLELPKGTVLEVEFVHELQGEVRMTSVSIVANRFLVIKLFSLASFQYTL